MRPRVVIVSHLDASGSHGIGPEMRAIETLGAEPLPVISAMALGPPSAPSRLFPVPFRTLRTLLRTALEQEPSAALISLLPRRRQARIVADEIKAMGPPTVVLAPYNLDFDARPLMQRGVAARVMRDLVPEATALVVPAPQMGALVPSGNESFSSAKETSQDLLRAGARSVWLRAATHEGRSIDIFADHQGTGFLDYPAPTPEAEPNVAPAALAALLAIGVPLRQAVDKAHRHACALDRAVHRAGK